MNIENNKIIPKLPDSIAIETVNFIRIETLKGKINIYFEND